MRTFIAFNISKNAKEKLSRIIDQIKEKNTKKTISYVRAENFHITLHFLGDIAEEKIENLKQKLTQAVKNFHPIWLKTNGISAFPSLQKPHALFIETIGNVEKAVSLQKNIAKILQTQSIDADTRPWKPHITIARIKNYSSVNIEGIKVPMVEFVINSMELVKSALTSEGSIYTTIESFRFD